MANYDARNVHTPESRSKRSISREEQLKQAEERVKHAVNLSEIDDSFNNFANAPMGNENVSDVARIGQNAAGVSHS